MKLLRVIWFTFAFTFYLGHPALAASSGGGGDMSLSWYCASLDTVGSNYQSFCSAYSPNSSLYELQLHNQLYGWSSTYSPTTCYPLGSYLDHQDDTTVGHNTNDFVVNAWQLTGPNFSYDDELSGVLLWWFNPIDSSGNDGVFTNVKGPCY